MNELDLDALAEWVVDPVGAALIAELRACREERDRLSEVWDADLSIVEDLAAGWRLRAERAEARIAAALEYHVKRDTGYCKCGGVWPCWDRRALTGGDQ